ncbi:MAG: ABC transporter, partial [Nonomuraea sp.]|nr:ABC transporter [Nonomuraea sp.]
MRTLLRLLRHPLGLVSALVLAVIVLAVVFAPLLSPQAPDVSSLRDAFEGPAAGHPLGFDSAGRDLLSRLLHGGRNTLGGAAIALAV